MKFDLVHDWFDLGIRPKVNKLCHCAVTDTDVLN